MNTEQTSLDATFTIENIGGIDTTQTEIPPGVTILTGRNATNRTSFLQGIMAVLGSDQATLRANAEEGSVKLSIGEQAYSRHLVRKNGEVTMHGDPYLADATLANLFAFLHETNAARQAIKTNQEFYDIIMEPVDTSSIDSEIRQLEAERDDLDSKLEKLASLEQQLPSLEEDRVTLETEIEEKREELEAAEREIEALDADLDDTRGEKAALEEKLDQLRTVRGDLEETRNSIDSEQESISALEEDLEEIEQELTDMSTVPTQKIEQIDDELQNRRGRKQSVETFISDLQSVIQFNREMLDDEQYKLIVDRSNGGDGADASVTDQLVDESKEISCWTCGTTVERNQIDATIDNLRSLHQEKVEDRRSLEERIAELQTERDTLEEQRRKHQELVTKRENIEDEIDERTKRVQELQERHDELRGEVDTLEEDVDVLESDDYSEVIESHKKANRIDIELEHLEQERAATDAEIEQIEEKLDEREAIEAHRDELDSELTSLRNRIGNIEETAVEEFNTHMNEVLDLLSYENLERVWIERTERERRDGRRTVSQAQFDLHVVRSTADGAVYEDTVNHLSESEREVTGLIFALAGFFTHEVYEDVPFMLLDSIEAIDSERIARLIEYLQEFTEYLIVALLPEDAAAIDGDANRVAEI